MKGNKFPTFQPREWESNSSYNSNVVWIVAESTLIQEFPDRYIAYNKL
jgi:hypothetical protein